MDSSRPTNISGPFISTTTRNRSLPRRLAQYLRSIFRSRSPSKTTNEPLIAIVCVSDTHNTKPTLPDGDVLLHAGDLSQYGMFEEIQAQLDWLKTQPHQHKIVIAGNHDLLLDSAFVKSHPDRELDKRGKSRCDLDWGDIVYLQNSSVNIMCGQRSFSIFGSPLTPRCGNFAFQYEPSNDLWKGRVPRGTRILLTHGPPALHLDESKGCPYLLKELWRARPSLVVFGHIHNAHGQESTEFSVSQKLYEAIGLGKFPWVNLLFLVLVLLWEQVSRALGRRPDINSVRLINAACVHGRANEGINEIIVANL